MFSPAIGRAARTANSLSAAPASCFLRTTLKPAPQQSFRPGHQRRLSSSKPAPPPSSKKKASVLEDKTAANDGGPGRISVSAKKKQKDAWVAIPKHNIPYVEPTDHLDSAEVKMTSFFGLHRPMSSTRLIPHATSTAEFNALFDPTRFQDAQRRQVVNSVLQDSLNTLEDAIENLETKHKVHFEFHFEDSRQAPAAQEEPAFHLDQLYEPTEHSAKTSVSHMMPFAPPPAPKPHDKLAVQFRAITRSLSGGIDSAITQVPLPTPRVNRSTPFRKHVARRRFVDSMLLISVKRQRKLKMKKHKYKKLMKKTRLERRKLGRL